MTRLSLNSTWTTSEPSDLIVMAMTPVAFTESEDVEMNTELSFNESDVCQCIKCNLHLHPFHPGDTSMSKRFI